LKFPYINITSENKLLFIKISDSLEYFLVTKKADEYFIYLNGRTILLKGEKRGALQYDR